MWLHVIYRDSIAIHSISIDQLLNGQLAELPTKWHHLVPLLAPQITQVTKSMVNFTSQSCGNLQLAVC